MGSESKIAGRVPTAKPPALGDEFGNSLVSKRDRERGFNSLAPFQNPQDIPLHFESSMDELLGYCKSSMDDSGSDDDQPPRAGAITAANPNNDSHVEPTTPIATLAPLGPVRNSNSPRPSPTVCVSPSLPGVIPEVEFQGPEANFQAIEDAVRALPIPPLRIPSDTRRHSRDSGYESSDTIYERKRDEMSFL